MAGGCKELIPTVSEVKDYDTPLESVLKIIGNAPAEEKRQEFLDYTLRNWDQI